ncbi:MAG TPA: magnesium transporter [Bacteroidaceae bacterium]|jgi:magnesium transporter|nr:magnesium transporter [Bacteroidaceae bacterium]MBP8602132.1 magnesium transporter [Bacteroidaceae bacterium]HOD67818.1 magnesium transporter [Bacteroidaceae bacterium]HQL25355.1 magnesium transporter [Bacteroidaceae bacterium]
MEKEFLDNIIEKIENQDAVKLKIILDDMHPADIAELCDMLNVDDARLIYHQLDNETAADVLVEMDEDNRKRLLDELPSEIIAKKFIDNMETDDAVDIIQDLDEEKQEEVLAHIDDIEQASDIVDLMQYDEDSAGGLMATEMVVVNENMSMPECLQEMRKQAEDLDDIYNVYVVDDDGRLKGVFPLKKMITNPSVSKVKYVMDEDLISTRVETPIDEVVQLIEKYNLVSVPVIDSIGRLQGQITVDDVIDELREQQEHDYQMASGLTGYVEPADSVFRQMWSRVPWLLIGIFGGILNSKLLEHFESSFAAFTSLLFFIPLIGGTGGNVGTQSSALVVQGLANGSLNTSNILRQVFKESAVALMNAIALSLLVFVYNVFAFGLADPVTYAVPITMFILVIVATLWGTLLPLLFEKINIDPAIATGPFVQIGNDLLGMNIYMVVITMLIY